MEQWQCEGTTATAFSAHSSKFDIPTASVGLAGTQLNSSLYGTVVFDITLFNEVTQSDDILTNIRSSVIDSCIEVIIGLPDIRVHRLIHRIPSYFDTHDPTYLEFNANIDDTTSTVREVTRPLSLLRPGVSSPATNVAVCRGASPCKTCVDLIAMGYDNTLCSLAGRPHTPRPGEIRERPPISEAELIKKRDIFDPSKMMTTSTGSIILSTLTSSTMKGNHRSSLCPRLPSKGHLSFRRDSELQLENLSMFLLSRCVGSLLQSN